MSSIERECKQDAGKFIPIVDRNRCEGKKDCVAICPYNVFTIGTLPAEQRNALSFIGRLKGYGHKWQQAFATNADACHACGLCVAACPERALSLTRA
jgi:NAD-dependent dihydropyrimidine dehydrogenase PreA subunit